MKNLISGAVRDFSIEFVRYPYLCYTEHGQHALFFTQLFNAIPESKRYVDWNGEKVCVIQKEYPTAHNLGKSKRQHWDIAIIKSPPTSKMDRDQSYDFLSLKAVVEFGMNVEIDHLEDDIERIIHPNSNVEMGFVVHYHRLSTPGAQFSGRDKSPRSKQIVSIDEIVRLVEGKPIEVYYAMKDITGKYENGVWVIDHLGKVKKFVNA